MAFSHQRYHVGVTADYFEEIFEFWAQAIVVGHVLWLAALKTRDGKRGFWQLGDSEQWKMAFKQFVPVIRNFSEAILELRGQTIVVG